MAQRSLVSLGLDKLGAVGDDVAFVNFLRGSVAFQAQDLAAARTALERARDLQPEADAIYVLLAQVYQGLGEDELAQSVVDLRGDESVRYDEPLLEEIFALSQGTSYRAVQTARGLMASQRFEQALALLSETVLDDPDDPDALYFLAIAAAQLNRNEQAIAALERSEVLRPGLGANRIRASASPGSPMATERPAYEPSRIR